MPKNTLGDEEFLVSIDDGWCEWSYKIKATDDFSIHNLIEKLRQSIGAEVPEGVVRRPYIQE